MDHTYTEYVDIERLVKNPLASVVMITYNHERYLAEAIKGVIRQETTFPFELVIGDDCSSDGTRNVALEYQKQYPEIIRVISSEQNIGMHRNFARVMAASRGKYTAFCEGDDFWHRHDKLALQISALEADPAVVLVCSDHREVSDTGRVLKENHHSFPTNDWVSYDDLIFGGNVIPALTVCARTSLVRRAQLESPLCPDFSLLMGDLPLWLGLSQYGRIRYLQQPLASYRIVANSASRKSNPIFAYRFNLNACDIAYQFLEKYPLSSGPSDTLKQLKTLIRLQLKYAAFAGDAQSAKRQIERLKSHEFHVNVSDAFLSLVARLPLGRGVTVPAARAMSLILRRLK